MLDERTPEAEEQARVDQETALDEARAKELESDKRLEREMASRTRRSFLVGGVAALGGFGAWEWMKSRRQDVGTPWPLRRMLDTNEEIARDYFRTGRLAAQYPVSQAVKNLRINERIGMKDILVPADWSLKVDGADIDTDSDDGSVTLSMDDIRKFPHAEHVTLLKCIEGWSEIVHWGGTRFADFAKEYPPPDGYPYVGIETPDAEYYVGLDLESAMQPQTLLCYELNGEPLPEPHGAPLRLVIPTKYGIKNLKRIGRIFYAQERPRDYWAEFGYDWYAGF